MLPIVMLTLAVFLALFIGLSLGMLGGGGAVLTTPILVYVMGKEPDEAIASSLLVVGVTSAVSTVIHARRGNIAWPTGALFGVAGMAGAYVGGRLSGYLGGEVLLVAFALVMLVTALAMIRGRSSGSASGRGDRRMHPVKAVSVGTAVGVVAGLVGAGGGFLIVPALTLFGGVPMLRAIGTSLFVITLQSFAGFLGHVGHVHLDVADVSMFALSAIFGTLLGAALAHRLPARTLSSAFAWFVLAMGLFVLGKQISLPALLVVASAAVLLALVAARASRAARVAARAV